MPKDLLLLVPDICMEKTVQTLLEYRRESLRIRKLRFEFIRHPGRDGGVRAHAHNVLGPHHGEYNNAVVLFDYEGCGQDDAITTSGAIENSITDAIVRTGWKRDSVLVVVICPELEAWVWGDSPHIAQVLGWTGDDDAQDIKSHLIQNGFALDNRGKPNCPKSAMDYVLRQSRIPRSASIFQSIAKKVSLRRCQDTSFLKLCEFLHRKFPQA